MPRSQGIKPSESYVDLHFPLVGIDLSKGFDRQPHRPMGDGVYASTTPSGINVRAYEPTTDRARGGQRPGLKRYLNAQVNGAALIQHLNSLVGLGYTAPGGGVQTSQSGRVVTLVAVSGGTVKVADAGATSWTAVTSGTTALNTTGVIYSSPLNQKLYFADGTNWKYYDPSDNAMHTWSASAGSLPVDSDSNKPRLIETWRARIVLSGLIKDSQNVFMSKVGDATNFDYSPSSPSAVQAVAFNNPPFGLVGDTVTCLIPFSDDVLLIGCDHEIHMLQGDPLYGGQLSRVSDSIGIAWGRPWCKDPYGAIYFVSNRMGIYRLTPGQPPQRISQQIEQLLQLVNTGTATIRLIWDDRFQGLHVFITPTASAAAATHFFWEYRVNAWWIDRFGNNNHNPLCCVVFDGNTATDRAALIGSWDGYVRYLSPDATKDDGTEIASSVFLGPILTKDLDAVLIKDIQAVLGEDSGNVTFAVHVGRSAEKAFSSTAVLTGTWREGRNLSNFIRRAGHACYIKVSATAPWALETIRARVAGKGKVQRRGR